MGIQQYWEEVKPAIDSELERRVLYSPLSQDIPWRYLQAIEQSIEGGKRLRGMMTCLVCDALGGRRSDAMLRAACIECIHAATLVHDDIIDGDTTRRGKPAIWTFEGVGKEGAILIGDLLWAMSMHMVSSLGREEEIEAASSTMVKVVRGVLYERAIVNTSVVSTAGNVPFKPSSILYDKVAELKTGALFYLAGRLGALATGNRSLSGLASAYGMRCGNAFQAADDLVDIMRTCEGKHESKLTGRLQRKIRENIAEAVAALSEFPDNEYTGILKELPVFMTDMMLSEVGS